MPILPYHGVWPTIAPGVFIAPTAVVAGNVTVEAEASIWFGAVIRGDSAAVRIGQRSNVQDNCVIHVDEGHPCVIGVDCTLGHGAVVHGATLGDRVLIGIHASVLNGALVAEDCIVAAGALVAEGKEMPAGSLVMGVPGKVVRPVSEEERTRSLHGVQHYVAYAQIYRTALGEAQPLA
jgi:carbonic anhydrase/acetyltransferase-like protein (isoleucine patch superfamily)